MTPTVVETLLASPATDLLRLVVVPVFGWAAYRDVRTRRVRNWVWLPLLTLGVLLLVGDYYRALELSAYRRSLFFTRVAASLGIVAPLGYVFYRLGGFGGADAKAVMTLALLFPTFPTYYLPSSTLPTTVPPLGVFSLTILSNTVIAGIAYPLVLAAGNLARGRLAPAMFIGRPVDVPAVATEYGRLLETPDGFTRKGLDLDALRMYLRWRGTTLSAVRRDPDAFRDPVTVPPPAERNAPGDGALADGPPVTDGGSGELEPAVRPVEDGEVVGERDEWGAAAFLADAGGAYGTTPDQLRGGLEVLCRTESVWVTPGIPFIVPMFVGLLLALTFGDVLFAVLTALGLA